MKFYKFFASYGQPVPPFLCRILVIIPRNITKRLQLHIHFTPLERDPACAAQAGCTILWAEGGGGSTQPCNRGPLRLERALRRGCRAGPGACALGLRSGRSSACGLSSPEKTVVNAGKICYTAKEYPLPSLGTASAPRDGAAGRPLPGRAL